MEGGHDHGPWRIEPINNYQGDATLVGAAIVNDQVVIAEVRGAIFVGVSDHPVNQANAFLISAAPDLLQALKKARLFFEDDPKRATLAELGVVAHIDFAVAKAEGRAKPEPEDDLDVSPLEEQLGRARRHLRHIQIAAAEELADTREPGMIRFLEMLHREAVLGQLAHPGVINEKAER